MGWDVDGVQVRFVGTRTIIVAALLWFLSISGQTQAVSTAFLWDSEEFGCGRGLLCLVCGFDLFLQALLPRENHPP